MAKTRDTEKVTRTKIESSADEDVFEIRLDGKFIGTDVLPVVAPPLTLEQRLENVESALSLRPRE